MAARSPAFKINYAHPDESLITNHICVQRNVAVQFLRKHLSALWLEAQMQVGHCTAMSSNACNLEKHPVRRGVGRFTAIPKHKKSKSRCMIPGVT